MEKENKTAPETTAQEENKEEKVKGKEQKKASKADKKLSELEDKLSQAEKDKETAQSKLSEAKDNYVRLMADFDNFRRHTSETQLKMVGNASADVIKGLLPVLDDFERALKVLRESQELAPAVEGTELIYTKLMSFLKTKGLEVIEAKGQAFDTDKHEAVAQFPVPDEEMKGKVFDVAQTGYTLNGEVIRFAKVVVAI